MKIFEHPNLTNFICPVCGGNEDKPVTLIPIDGTQNGKIIEARQYHVDCLNLMEITGRDGIIFLVQRVTD